MARKTLVSEALAVRANAAEPVLERLSGLLDEKMEVDVERIVLYVLGHFFQHRIVYYLRRRLALDDSAFERFQEHFGASVDNFVHEMRIEVAKGMLRGSDLTITAISHHLGFATPRAFVVFFENRVGMSPTRFREPGNPGPHRALSIACSEGGA